MLARGFALFLVATVSAAADGPTERAAAEGTVILRLAEQQSTILQAVVVDLPAREVALIRDAVPQLAKLLLSSDETSPPRVLPKRSLQIAFKSVDVTSTRATIITSNPRMGVSSSGERFILEKRADKWQIVHHDFR
jgi:hypothetical protein